MIVHAVRRREARTSFFSPTSLPMRTGPLRSPSDPIPPWSTTLMQSEDMRRRRHDPVVDHPEDASCKNKRTGSLGMSRDSVLYRSPAYIDTNLCPPQAVLCICHIYIYFLSLNLLLCLVLAPSPPPSLLSTLGFSLSHPFCDPLYLPLSSIRSRPPLFSFPLRSGEFPTRIQKPEVCTRVCVAPPPPTATVDATTTHRGPLCVGGTCCGGDRA